MAGPKGQEKSPRREPGRWPPWWKGGAPGDRKAWGGLGRAWGRASGESQGWVQGHLGPDLDLGRVPQTEVPLPTCARRARGPAPSATPPRATLTWCLVRPTVRPRTSWSPRRPVTREPPEKPRKRRRPGASSPSVVCCLPCGRDRLWAPGDTFHATTAASALPPTALWLGQFFPPRVTVPRWASWALQGCAQKLLCRHCHFQNVLWPL